MVTVKDVKHCLCAEMINFCMHIWASVKLGDTLAMLIWRETINGILCCFDGNTDK